MVNLKNSRGITLIALVVTIIVIIILAAVSISNLTGGDGIVDNAKQAKDRSESSNDNEMLELAVISAMQSRGGLTSSSISQYLSSNGLIEGEDFSVSDEGDKIIVSFIKNGRSFEIDNDGNVKVAQQGGGGGPTTSNLNTAETDALQENGIGEAEVVTNETINSNPNIRAVITGEVPIPNGFYYVGGTLNEGVVISDNEADSGKGTSHAVAQTLVGNQFVWVPVPVAENFQRYDGYYNGALESTQSWFDITNCSEPYTSGYSTESSEYTAMYNSTTENKGFYVGRYEASQGTTGAESKQGKNAWTSISWGTSMNDIGTTGAVYQSQQMYTGKAGFNVTSTLIYGVQWDAIMYWIDPAYKTGTCNTSTSYVANSTGKGYYDQSSPTTTGSSVDYAVKNIYDLAGNVWEWTMEARNTSYRVGRGGNFNNGGSGNPASYRGNNYPSSSNDSVGFRLALYL